MMLSLRARQAGRQRFSHQQQLLMHDAGPRVTRSFAPTAAVMRLASSSTEAALVAKSANQRSSLPNSCPRCLMSAGARRLFSSSSEASDSQPAQSSSAAASSESGLAKSPATSSAASPSSASSLPPSSDRCDLPSKPPNGGNGGNGNGSTQQQHGSTRWTYRYWQSKESLDLRNLQTHARSTGAEQGAATTKEQDAQRPKAKKKPKRSWRQRAAALLQKGRSLLAAVVAHGRTARRNPRIILQWAAQGWTATKTVAKHYWSGTKLLAADIRTAVQLLRKMANARVVSGRGGHSGSGSGSGRQELTWRERRQLRRTAMDLARLGPFLVVILVPFMELSLPLLLRLFPGFLPSTFQSKAKREARLERELELRVELADLLQETVAKVAKEKVAARKKKLKQQQQQLTEGSGDGAAIAPSSSSSSSPSSALQDRCAATHLLELLDEVRHGKRVSAREMARLSSLFRESITLERMGRKQLVRLAKFFGLFPIQSDALLRFQLHRKIARLREDDPFLLAQLGDLRGNELRAACHERGIRSVGMTDEGYRRALQSWLDLSLHPEGVPSSLLLLSRPLGLMEQRPSPSSIREALLTMDQDLLDEITPIVAGQEEEEMDSEKRLELLKLENARIKEEEEQAKRDEQAAAAAAAAASSTPTGAEDPRQQRTTDAEPKKSPSSSTAATDAAASTPDFLSLAHQLLSMLRADLERSRELRAKARKLKQKQAEAEAEAEERERRRAECGEQDARDEQQEQPSSTDGAATANSSRSAEPRAPATEPSADDASLAAAQPATEAEDEEEGSLASSLLSSLLSSKVERLLRDIDRGIAETQEAEKSSEAATGGEQQSDAALQRWIERTLSARGTTVSEPEARRLLTLLRAMCEHEGLPLTHATLRRLTQLARADEPSDQTSPASPPEK